MNKFIGEDGTYYKYIQGMYYHITHIVILGAKVCQRSVEEEVKSNSFSIVFCRDHVDRYQPSSNREIQSEGISKDKDVSIEGAMLIYKPINGDAFREIMYYHISDGKKQNASTIYCNIMHAFDNLDKNN